MKVIILIIIFAVIIATMIILFERNREKYNRKFYPKKGDEDKFKYL